MILMKRTCAGILGSAPVCTVSTQAFYRIIKGLQKKSHGMQRHVLQDHTSVCYIHVICIYWDKPKFKSFGAATGVERAKNFLILNHQSRARANGALTHPNLVNENFENSTRYCTAR